MLETNINSVIHSAFNVTIIILSKRTRIEDESYVALFLLQNFKNYIEFKKFFYKSGTFSKY